VFSYVGTTAPRAQETLDVLIGELRRLSDGIEQGEFDRAIVGMKSRLVMQGESTSARAHAIAYDQYTLGRARTLEQRRAEVDAVTLDGLCRYVAGRRPEKMTIVTIGPEPLVPRVEVAV
jgi:predicted Zn-dependent peptidase